MHELFLKKDVTIINYFQKFLDEIWVGKGNEFYNRSIKSWLKDNIGMH